MFNVKMHKNHLSKSHFIAQFLVYCFRLQNKKPFTKKKKSECVCVSVWHNKNMYTQVFILNSDMFPSFRETKEKCIEFHEKQWKKHRTKKTEKENTKHTLHTNPNNV